MVAELMFFNGTVKSISHLVSICRLSAAVVETVVDVVPLAIAVHLA